MNINVILHHWKYFLSLEKDFINMKNYIEISENNFNVYSFELLKLLQLSCSEIDSLLRIICKIIDTASRYDDESVFNGQIALFKGIILNKYPRLIESEIKIPDLKDNIKPWDDWRTKNSPDWWVSYNKVKHYRHSCFNQANLRNVIFSFSSLMVLNLYLYRIVAGTKKANPEPSATYFNSKYCSPILLANAEEELPDFR